MTIRKQFLWLKILLIAIPCLCAGFLATYRYLISSTHLIDGYKELKKIEFSENDLQVIQDTLKMLPSDIETSIVTREGTIIYSDFDEYNEKTAIDFKEEWDFIKETSNKYFYQFTSVPLEDNNHAIMYTRISRDRHKKKNPLYILKPLFIFLIIIVIGLLFIVAYISRNIFNSIVLIQNKTADISNENLTTPVIDSGFNKKENEITTILKSLEQMRLSLLDNQQRRSKFIMGISHDLRTPVAIIKGYTEALKDGFIQDEEETKKTYELIETKTNQLEEMINTLINFMKLNETEIREQLQKESITKLITLFAKEAQITANVYKRQIETDINLPEERLIPLNRQLVQRALENIFSNALRYTKENDKIIISAKEENKSIILSISDTGIGIDNEDLNHIFDLFYRGTNSRREEGMGIGLSVVKNIIDTHGWKINVTSKKNDGSNFIITIPLE